jgi:hypothetical protein
LGHKLLKTIFILFSRKEPCKDSTVDYRELVVKRNAPRWIAALRQYNMLPVAT